jgi:hypothetical protein
VKFLRQVRILSLLLLLLLAPSFAAGQLLPSADVSLENMNLSAEKIFSGTVVQIEHAITTDEQPAAVRVKFRVDEAVRGCNAGDMVTVDEWAGLWVHGDRYRTGQRVLILLYPPSQTGLSSPVAGDVGTFHIGPDGLLQTTLQQAQILAAQATKSQPVVRPPHGEPDPKKVRPRLRSIPGQRKLTPLGEAAE